VSSSSSKPTLATAGRGRRFARFVLGPPRSRRRRAAISAALGALTALGLVAWADASVREATSGRLFDAADDVPKRYVAIVLGAGVVDGAPSDVLADRLATALALFKRGRVERFLVTGDHGAPGYDEVAAMQRYLLDAGVPASAVFLDHAGFRTLDSMVRAKAVFQVDGAVVVTQAFHLARAVYLARAQGIDAVGVAADRRRYLGSGWYALRERLARVQAFVDAQGLGRQAKFLGAPIPITGDAALSWDAATAAAAQARRPPDP
jgi:SanA protein